MATVNERKHKAHIPSHGMSLLLLAALVGCNAISGLDEFKTGAAYQPPATLQPQGIVGGAAAEEFVCSTNRECSDRLTAAGSSKPTPAVCLRAERRCARLTSEDCREVTGDFLNDDAIIIASLFSTTGPQATTNQHRQQAASLAVSEVNAAGGIPAGRTSARGRPLVMVSCDEVADLKRVATHLVHELHVPAIVGPNTSQDTLDLSTMFTIEAGTLVISPTAVASSISDLLDDDLTWLMVPSDVQRAPLMIGQVNALEEQLVRERGRDRLRLGVIYRNDALGIGTRVSLNGLRFNGAPIAAQENLGSQVRMDGYEFSSPDQNALVSTYVQFAPDVIVLAGTAEAITGIMLPLEQQWDVARNPRPQYLLTDSSKIPELLDAVSRDDDLRRRIRGSGVTPSPGSQPVYNAFRLDYGATFDGSVTFSGMGPAYDASYAVAYALAAMHDAPITGASIAQGLRRLGNGRKVVEVGLTTVLAAFQELVAGESIRALGTFSPLEWTPSGAVASATLEVWCVSGGATPAFRGSGLTFDIGTQAFSGTYSGCTP